MRFYKQNSNKKVNKKILTLVIIISVILGYLIWGNNYVFVDQFQVTNKKIPIEFDNYKIVVISDLHSKKIIGGNQYLYNLVVAQKPDIILFAGDMLDSLDKNTDVYIDLAKRLVKIAPIYAIDGNHEQVYKMYNANFQKHNYYDELSALGVNIINDKKVRIAKGNSYINLYGLVLPLSQYNNEYLKTEYSVNNMLRSFGAASANEYNVLLVHSPELLNIYSEWGADLVFAGHLHGGIVYVPFVGGLLSPNRELFPKYYAGEYNKNGTKMIVSRGVGDSRFTFRVLNNPEICAITLKRGD